MLTKEIIDAVAAGVNGLALPAHRTFKYHRPLSISGPNGAMVPALSVSPASIAPELLTTSEDYQYTHKLMITWYAATMSEIGVGIADETAAGATLDHVGLIIDLLHAWANGIDTVSAQNESTIGDVHFGHIPGGIWTVEINLSVTTWGI